MTGQSTLVNPSFEDVPSDATIPKGWHGCQEGTTPDILPGFWGEYKAAVHGDTYVGMITRENSTFESIGQRLSTVLERNTCYKFSINLSHGKVYSGYNKPIKLRIWIGGSKCEANQLIYESELINHSDWKTYFVEFTPNTNAQYIIIEAHHKEGNFNYKGNIMLDKVSTIIKCGRA